MGDEGGGGNVRKRNGQLSLKKGKTSVREHPIKEYARKG